MFWTQNLTYVKLKRNLRYLRKHVSFQNYSETPLVKLVTRLYFAVHFSQKL